MAKRKSRKVVKKARREEKLDTVFDCPYCAMKNAIKVVLNRKESLGKLWCVFCGASYSCKINNLSVAVDVFSEWMDESYEVNRQYEEEAPSASVNSNTNTPRKSPKRRLRKPQVDSEDEQNGMDADLLEDELTADVANEKSRKRSRKEMEENQAGSGSEVDAGDDV